jgi:hypothetical protein
VEAVVLSGLRLLQDEAAELAWVQDIVKIRDQTVAVVAIDSDAVRSEQAQLGLPGSIEIVVAPEGARGPVSKNTGPFTSVCERAILNYNASGGEALMWSPPSSAAKRRGDVTPALTCLSSSQRSFTPRRFSRRLLTTTRHIWGSTSAS